MKFLIFLIILLIVLALVVVRYRKQIQTALYMWRMFKKMRQMSQQTPEKRIEPNNNQKETPLVRCLSCGIWTPETKAFKLGAKSVYCSANCMERAVAR